MPSLKVCNESINVRSVISFSTIPKLCMQCVLIYMYIDTHILSLLKILFLKQKCFAYLSSSQHTPLTNHFLIKVQNKTARIDSTYRSQGESVFQRGSTL